MKLNLCCGANVFPGWLNVDRTDVEADYLRHLRDAPEEMQWPAAQQRLVDRIGEIQFMRHDVRTGLPWADGSVEAIYIGQAIEHFNRRTEAPALLRECARVLKSEGVIRLVTPCLITILTAWQSNGMERFNAEQPAFYATASEDECLSYLLFGASGEGCTSENYEGHFHIYERQALQSLLSQCGLRFSLTGNPEFDDCVDFGLSHSFAIEAVKP